MTFVNIEQAEFWSQLAPTWLELEDQLEEVGRLPGQLALDRLELLPGQRVVDLGCGSGRTTLELASRVGLDGRYGVDIAEGMVARGPERAARLAPRTSSLSSPTSRCTTSTKPASTPPSPASA